MLFEEAEDLFFHKEMDLRFKRLSDHLVLAGVFEEPKRQIANIEKVFPLFEQRRWIFGEDLSRGRELGEVDARFAAFDGGEIVPNFVGGEAEDGRDETNEGFGDLPEDRKST